MSFRASPIKDLQSYQSYPHPIIPFSPIRPLDDQNQNLNDMIHHKNIEITKLYDEINQITKAYQNQIQTYQKTISSFEKQLSQQQILRDTELSKIKEKFEQITTQQSQNLKSLHDHEIEFLLKQIAQQRTANNTLNLKINLKDQQIQNLKQSYERQITANTAQINSLNKIIHKLEEDKNKQIRDLNSKRQLEKSRTSGLITSRRQNHTFMDKQIRKLNEQVLEKTIQIETLSRELTRQRKKTQDIFRSNSNLISELKQNHALELENKNQQFARSQKTFKAQIAQNKQLQAKYIEEIQTLKSTINIQQKSFDSLKQVIKNKQEQIQNLKQMIEKNRDEHARQINSLMKQRRKGRSNIGSSRSIISLKDSGIISDSPPQTPHQMDSNTLSRLDSNFEGSGRLQRNLHPIKQQTPERNQQHDYSRQLADSQLDDENIESDLEKAVYHYDNLIDELKRNHNSEVQLLKINEKKIRSRLEQKEQEILDILTKFSPLVKIHAREKSIEQDRKERIQRHWKSDVALLEVLLKKYKIRIFE